MRTFPPGMRPAPECALRQRLAGRWKPVARPGGYLARAVGQACGNRPQFSVDVPHDNGDPSDYQQTYSQEYRRDQTGEGPFGCRGGFGFGRLCFLPIHGTTGSLSPPVSAIGRACASRYGDSAGIGRFAATNCRNLFDANGISIDISAIMESIRRPSFVAGVPACESRPEPLWPHSGGSENRCDSLRRPCSRWRTRTA